MSLETKIEALTVAVQQLTATLQAQSSAPVQTATVPAGAPAFVPPAAPPQAPVAAPAAAPQMPPPPNFMATPSAPPQAAPALPFNDINGLVEYVTKSFYDLGPRGNEAVAVMTNLGYKNVTEVQPAHFAAVFQGIEALKGA